MQMIWCCGLSELARIKSENQVVKFYKEENVVFLKDKALVITGDP